jgi:hypothetical protein
MAGQYDYSINIPQPPAQNFLQSLLGIQQLKGLQQQSEIAQQQAGIQAQQAQFAQERQPLELQHLQEQINSQKLHQGLVGTQTEAAKFELGQKQDFQKSLNDLSSDPSKWTGDNFMQLGIKFHQADPNLLMNMAKMRASIPTKAQAFGDNLGQQLVLSTQIGDNETGKKLLESSIKIAQDDPELTKMVPQLQQLSDQYNKFPEKTSVIAAMGLQMLSPDKAKAMFGAMDERLKSEQTQAQIEETKAKAMKEQWAAVKMSQEIENGKPMSRPVTNIVDAATTASQSYGKISETAQSLRSELESLRSKMDSGKFTLMGKEAWKSAFGAQDEVSNFLTGFDRLVTSDLFKSLKDSTRGNMNVQELKTVGGTVPGKYDSAQRKAEYLDALVSAFDRQTQLESDKANFVSTFNTNGKATKDGEVSGIPVSKGTTLNDFLAQRKKELGAIKVFGGANEPPKPPAPPAGANPLEAELRRRGLLK